MPSKKIAVILLRNAEGKVLLQHRTNEAPTFPNHWALFGGHIESGETPEQAVVRECMEELGYKLARPKLLEVHRSVDQGTEYTIHAFTETYDGSTFTLGEGQGMAWFSPAATKDLLMADHVRSIVAAASDVR